MHIPFSLIEVFNDPKKEFKGNISTVVLLSSALDDATMQRIARDFNQPATTFLSPTEDAGTYHARWFAPDDEIDLCGHGSLAAFAFLGSRSESEAGKFTLSYRSGKITGSKGTENTATMTLAAIPTLAEMEIPDVLKEGLGVKINSYFATDNKQIVLLHNERDLREMKPDFAKLRESETFGYAVTAPGDEADFVSRTLVPHVQQLEDHATGSSHAALAPFWAAKLGKAKMIAHQLSPRGGKFICEIEGDKVRLEGNFSVLAKGEILDDEF